MRNKKILDILLLVLFFVCLSSTFLAEKMHEVCGLGFLAAVFVHNFFNRNFYKNFSTRKNSNKFCVIAFALALIVLAASGIMLWSAEHAFNWRSLHLGAAIVCVILLFVHLLTHAKKYIRGKIFYFVSVLSFLLAVAGIFGLPYLDRWYHKVEVKSTEIVQGEKILSDKKFLTVYFSRVGNTNFPLEVDAVSGASVMKDGKEIIGNAQMIAYMAQNIVGGDLIEIQTEKIYPSSYSETTKVAQEEFAGNELPTIKNLPEIKSYDQIILVYPLWWSKLPKAVESFLQNYDLSGKTIIPIVTHGGGGIGESIENLKELTSANIVQPLDIYSSDIPTARGKIFSHLKSVVDSYYERTEEIFGTTVTMKATGKNEKVAIDESFDSIFKLVENIKTDVKNLNDAAGSDEFIKISPEVFEMLKLSQYYSELTDGAFDVTIGAAVDLWRNARKNKFLPTPEEIVAVKNLVGFKHLHLNETQQSARLDLTGVKINLGGVGKGYGIDIARKIFTKYAISDGIIDFGTSSIFVFGKKRIGIKNPRADNEIVKAVELENATLSTSGDYEQFFIVDGRRYHHIINPKTCLPTDNGIASVTITLKGTVDNCGTITDILSTSILILGEDATDKLLKNLPAEFVVIPSNFPCR